MTAQELITRYEALFDLAESIRLRLQAERIRIMAPVQSELDAVQDELEPQINAAMAAASEVSDELKAAVIAEGETVKGSRLMAVWNKPRETWDSKALAGYAAAHPEIAQFRKVGEPTVTIRARGEK